MNPITSAPLFLYRTGMAWESDRTADPALWQLQEERQAAQSLLQQQTAENRDWICLQAAHLAEALLERRSAVCFRLPERVACMEENGEGTKLLEVPKEFQEQSIGGRLRKIPGGDLRAEIRQRLFHLEQSPYRAVAEGAKVVRYAVVRFLIRDWIPLHGMKGGISADGKPESDTAMDSSSSTAYSNLSFDPSALENMEKVEESVRDTKERLAILQQDIGALNLAISLAPYMFTDDAYQGIRCNAILQLVAQGQALSSLQTGVIIGKIKRGADAGELNRGLSLSLPYFDDQTLEMRLYEFEVIPKGRVLFVPAFVVLAARREQNRVAQEFHGSDSTRMHLLAELKALEQAFGGGSK
jgi:hypothetical protein